MARLKELYKAEVAPALMKQFGYKSVMQIPKIDKIRGMDIIIVTTAKTDEEGRALLQQVGAPFAR